MTACCMYIDSVKWEMVIIILSCAEQLAVIVQIPAKF